MNKIACNLQVLAGPKAYQHIQQQGLEPSHINSIFGASGAAKWLSIYGLDRTIFSNWLTNIDHHIHLFGTSVGAWKLAAAAQEDAATALSNLADAYIRQSYSGKPTMDDVIKESEKIIAAYLPPEKLEEILTHPNYHFHFGTVRCLGGLASEQPLRLTGSLTKALFNSLRGRAGLIKQVQRVVFSDPRALAPVAAADGYSTSLVSLNRQNFYPALVASGSIPFVMPGATNIDGATPGVYRDGGLLDYHPVPGHFWQDTGLILYPHFYPYLKAGWFDKLYRHRRAGSDLLDNVILLAPTPDYVASLPGGRLSDRKDFKRFRGRNQQRMDTWFNVKEQSLLLGEEFLQWVASGDIAKHVQPL